MHVELFIDDDSHIFNTVYPVDVVVVELELCVWIGMEEPGGHGLLRGKAETMRGRGS